MANVPDTAPGRISFHRVDQTVPYARSRGDMSSPHQPNLIALQSPGPAGAHGSTTEQTIELPLGDAVALTRSLHQAVAVYDRNLAAFIADEPSPLQRARRSRNAGALYPQHHRQELLREKKLIGLHAVVRHQ